MRLNMGTIVAGAVAGYLITKLLDGKGSKSDGIEGDIRFEETESGVIGVDPDRNPWQWGDYGTGAYD